MHLDRFRNCSVDESILAGTARVLQDDQKPPQIPPRDSEKSSEFAEAILDFHYRK